MDSGRQQDEAVDRLLRRALTPRDEGTAGACPDAGTLAAYVERGLTAADASAFEQHAAACARCQDTLALLAEMPAGAPPAEGTAPAPGGWSRWLDWRWLVPLGAVAGLAVAVYLAVRPAPADLEVAGGPEVSQAPPPAMAPGQATPQPASAPAAAEARAAAAPAVPVAAGPPPPSRTAPPRSGEGVTAPAAKGAPQASADAALAPAAPLAPQSRSAAEANLAAAQAELEAARAQRSPRRGEVAFQPAATQQSALAEGQPPASPPVVAGRVAAAPHEGAAPAPAAASPGGAVSTFATGVSAVRWRVGPGGRIERTTDAGRSWQPQASGVSTDLLAAATVSPRVAWVAGAAGTVLRTTDGARWEPCLPPTADDLVAVSASSATHAIVTARDGRRYATPDGGRTWQPAR